jgi:putative membrane protein
MMGHWLYPSLAGVPAFFIYFAASAAVLTVFGIVYIRLTAHHETDLIRQGNAAAAVGYGGALIGYCMPLSRSVAQAATIPDFLIWAVLALVVQVGAYYAARQIVPDISERIAKGDMAAAILLGALAIASGILNAASMTL